MLDEYFSNLEKKIINVVKETVKGELQNFFQERKRSIPIEEELITIKQCQLLLKLSKPSIYKLMRENKLPYKKAGKRLLFKKSEILDALNKKTQNNKFNK